VSHRGEESAFTRAGVASRLSGDARTASTLMQLLDSLPRRATYAMSIPSDDHVRVLLNTVFWASLQLEEGRPVAVPLLLRRLRPARIEDERCSRSSSWRSTSVTVMGRTRLAMAIPRLACLNSTSVTKH